MQMRVTMKNLSRGYWEPVARLELPTSWFKQQSEIRLLQLADDDLYQIEVGESCVPALKGIVLSGGKNISEKVNQLNHLARKLEGMDAVVQGIYSKVVEDYRSKCQESADLIDELSRLTDTISSYTFYEGIYNDELLGEVCITNKWLGSVDGIPEALMDCLSRAKMGEKYRKSVYGVYTSSGFAMPDTLEPTLASKEDNTVSHRNLLDEKSVGTLRIILRTMEEDQEKTFCWTLPDEEKGYRKLGEVKYRSSGKPEAGIYQIQECDCIIPQLNMMLKRKGNFEKWNEMAECLAQIEKSGQLLKYTALLSMKASESVEEALVLAKKLDSYDYLSDICSAHEYGRIVLQQAGLDVKDALAADMDLMKFGEIKLKQKNFYCSPYGLLKEKMNQVQNLNELHQMPVLLTSQLGQTAKDSGSIKMHI